VKGIVGLAVAATVGFVVIQLAPLFAAWVETKKLQAYKALAARNPIETLESIYLDKSEALQVMKEKIKAFNTTVKTFAGQVETFSKNYPERAAEFTKQLETMEELLAKREDKYRAANTALGKFKNEIAEADAYWKMAQAAKGMAQAAGAFDGDALQDIRTNTAMQSVETAMYDAFSQLETDLLDEVPAVPKLAPAQSNVIDITPTLAKEEKSEVSNRR